MKPRRRKKRLRANARQLPKSGDVALPDQPAHYIRRATRQAPVAPQLIEQPLEFFSKDNVEARVNAFIESRMINRT
jgi:hypothetical protein